MHLVYKVLLEKLIPVLSYIASCVPIMMYCLRLFVVIPLPLACYKYKLVTLFEGTTGFQ